MNSSDFGTIIQIGDILVSEDVIMDFFACDYPVCKGICCIEGDSGAPLEEDELEGLERDYPEYSAEMRPQGRCRVDEVGFFEVDRDGDLVTPVVCETKECAFTHFLPDGSALCAIEKCGLIKPVSCRLYPIRVTKLTGGGLALNVHHWDICKPAFEKGRREGIRVYQFLKGPITARFGQEFFQALDAAAQHLLSDLPDQNR
ncbi:MAG: DUF3109 family protein [Bacteroidales bacterium]|nr:DUF3109 family protein [Bacteroidales bacterium]